MAVKKIAACYSIIVGVLMISMWSFFLFAGMVPEFQETPYSISMHLLGEGSTAALLIIGGIGLFKKTKWALKIHLISVGMLIYTLIVSPGYYLDLGQIYIPLLFAILLIFTIVITIMLLVKRKKPGLD